jgi:hypothetical protein
LETLSIWIEGIHRAIAHEEEVEMKNMQLKEPFSPYGKFARQRGPTDSEIAEAKKYYKAEVKRRRRIGKTIDPVTAETMFWWADLYDPYCILDRMFHIGCIQREHFARNPGGEWVHFYDLPAKTCKALWKRDGHKLSFPYGLHAGDDVINYPPRDRAQEEK